MDGYPYPLTNAAEVLAGYAAADVRLSLSGHYHPGLPPATLGALTCWTVPAACEPPFSCGLVRLRGERMDLRTEPLGPDLPSSP